MVFPASARWWLAGLAVVSLAVGSTIAADRSSSAMSSAATKFLAGLARAAAESGAAVSRRRTVQVAFRPGAADVRAPGHPHQGHERSPAQARARPAEGRLEPARLPYRLVHHGTGNRARRARSGGARGGRTPGRRDRSRSRALLSRCSATRRGTTRGDGAWKGITSRCISPS